MNLFLVSEVYMVSDIINLLHHFSYVFTLFLQDGLNALALVGTESDGGFLRTQYLFHLPLLIVFFHSNLFDGIAQMSKLIRYQL
uniref:Putative nuclear pore complex nup88/rnup84 component n=1 Tax=Ixodes ricinus TaxID=34613 RepID=A0A0K8R679_IXORI